MIRADEMWMLVVLLLYAHVQTGTCDSCHPGYYKDKYNDRCDQCPENCATCTWPTSHSCDTCNEGYYGYGCRSQCSESCESKHCRKSNGWCTCIEGYYLYHYNESGLHYTCVDCPEKCITCTSAECTRCNAGYFGRICSKLCDYCRNNTCSIDGRCTDRCLDGFYPNTTGCETCPDNCVACTSLTDCTSCNTGYYGTKCEKRHPCIDGAWSPKCGNRCNDACIRCNQTTGQCTGCKTDKFGRYCEPNCSRHCVQVSTSLSTCRQHNGSCTDGCVQGFSGSNCTDECSQTTYSHVALIVASTSGAVALLVVVIIVVILMWRMRVCQPDSKDRTEKPMGSGGLHAVNEVLNLTFDDTDDEPTTLSGHQTQHSGVAVGSAEHFYHVLHKVSLRKPAQPNKADRQETDNIYDTTSRGHGPGMQADIKMSHVLGDTYSHISHASRARQLRADDEDAYDHVTRYNLQKGYDGGDTYDVARRHNNHVQNTSPYSNVEYST